MQKKLPVNLFIGILFLCLSVLVFVEFPLDNKDIPTGAPPYGEAEYEVPDIEPDFPWGNWKRPDGPPRIGLQVGHLNSSEFPDELARLRNNTGASGGGVSEWQVNLAIAEKTKVLLEERGIIVDLIPATVPENYLADAFIAIHADGNLDTTKTGFKVAAPWRDYTRKANKLANIIEAEYQVATGFEIDPNVTRNMRGYYAFSWWRFDHAIHPMTPGVILETGFLSNPNDRKLIVDQPEISAKAVADAVYKYLETEKII